MKVLAFSNHVTLGGTVSERVRFTHDNFGTLWADFLLSTFPEEATSRDKGFAIRCKTYGPCAEALQKESRKEVCVIGELKAADFSYGKYSWLKRIKQQPGLEGTFDSWRANGRRTDR